MKSSGLSRQDALSFFGGDELAADVFLKKYAVTKPDGSLVEYLPSQMWERMAKAAASVEVDKDHWAQVFYDALTDWKMVPQGSIMFALGNPYQRSSCSNCFVIPIHDDSLDGIFDCAKEMSKTYAYRGGVGTDISALRPEGAVVSNAARTSTGAWSFMDFYSYVTRLIGQHGRRGALMITIADSHPDLLNFINSKKDKTKVTGANISVRLSDEFMQAVSDGTEWEMSFDTKHETMTRTMPARDIWDLIVETATTSAEPGILFWDTILKESPSDCYADEGFRTICANPCSEIPLPAYDACTLLSMNLTKYTRNNFTREAHFDFKAFKKDTQIATRFLDNVKEIDLKLMPLKKQKDIAAKGRRIGMGTNGLGDALANLGIRYDSDRAVEFVDELYKFYAKTVYGASVELAREKGAFPIFDAKKEKGNPFLNRIGFAGKPRRNIACLTCAPTGSLSCMCQTSSGVEPVFRNFYTRRRKITHNEAVSIPKGSLFQDKMGEYWQEYTVAHHNVQQYLEYKGIKLDTNDESEVKLPQYFVESHEIDWNQRVKLQATMQKWIDHAISSCLAEGTASITTTEGLLEIEEFNPHELVKSFQKPKVDSESVNIQNSRASITEVYNNGASETLEITLQGGQKIIGTTQHKINVLDHNGGLCWKELNEISVDDIVVGRKGLNIWKSNASRISIHTLNMSDRFDYDRKTNSKNVQIPKYMSSRLARFLGYICSDGHVSRNGFQLTQIDNNVCDDFEDLVDQLFDLPVTRVSDNRVPNLLNLQVNSREAASWLKWLGLSNHNEISVPLVVRRGSSPMVKQFIKGMTLDGHVSSGNVCVASSISYKMLQQIQCLLLNLGIESNLLKVSDVAKRQFPLGNEYITRPSWTLVISDAGEASRFINSIGFAENRKNEECKTKFKHTSRLKRIGQIPDFGFRLKFREMILPLIRSSRLYEMFHSLTCYDKQGRLMNRESLLEMVDLGLEVPDYFVDNTYTFKRVKDKTESGIRQTWDLSVPDGNSYIANGIVNHNTCNLPAGTDKEVVKQVYMKAYKQGCKGFTVYVDGCREGQPLVSEDNTIHKTDAPKRPKTLDADVYHATVKGELYFVMVGILKGEPYEVFAGQNGFIGRKVNKAKITKRTRGAYEALLEDNTVISNIGEYITDEQAAVTRLISLSLRHGADMKHCVNVLEKVPGDLLNFARSIARVLKKYIPNGTKVTGRRCDNCGSENLIRQEGCVLCIDCGMSGCS